MLPRHHHRPSTSLLRISPTPITSTSKTTSTPSTILLKLLNPIRIAQRIKRMLRAAQARRNIRNHKRLAVPNERVPKHKRKLAAAERCMLLILIQRPDTLLQRQQTFVYFRAVKFRLFIGADSVSSSFGSCEVNEADFPVRFAAAVFDAYLQNAV